MLLLDQKGWILSPNENKTKLEERISSIPADSEFHPIPDHPAHDITEKLFDFRFEEVPIFISEESLSLWQGAALWIYNKEGKSFPVIQLSPKRKDRQTEFLAHELVHAARFSFKEPFFEEIIAYQTSPSRLYRFLGPLFLFPSEPWIWIILSSISFFLFFFFDSLFFLYAPSVLLCCFFLRLSCLQILFALAKKHLKKAGIKNPLPLLLRSSDKQILRSALCFSSKKIQSIFHLDSRFKLILFRYFESEACE